MFIDKKNIQIVQNTVKKWKNQSLVSKKYQKYIVENSSTSSCRSFLASGPHVLLHRWLSSTQPLLPLLPPRNTSRNRRISSWGGPPPPPGAERAWAAARAEAAEASWASHRGPRRSKGPPPRPPGCGQPPHPPGSASGAGSPPHLRIKKQQC